MKQKSFSPNQKSAGASRTVAALETGQSKSAILPSPDEIAIRSYFSYVNESSLPEHEEQHWLEA